MVASEAKVGDASWSQRIVRRLTPTVATEGYEPGNANLHFTQRLLFRNSLTIVYSLIPQAPAVLVYWGTLALVDWISTDKPSVRLGVWCILVVVFGETLFNVIKSSINPNYIFRKPLQWLFHTATWSVCLVLSGGDLGLWSFGVVALGFFLAVFASDIINLGWSVSDSLYNATLVVVVLCAYLPLSSGYVYVVSSISDPWLILGLTGVLYPGVSYIIKEISFGELTQANNKDQGIDEADEDSTERGNFIDIVLFVECTLELPNKLAMARLATRGGFASSIVTALVIEVAVKVGVMWWHRNKGWFKMNANRVGSGRLPTLANSGGDGGRRQRVLRQASLRHDNVAAKKRYEILVYYEEMGESLATVLAILSLMIREELAVEELCLRLAMALALEYVADLGVWYALELDGYSLTNVVCQLSVVRTASVICSSLVALSCVMMGEEMTAMFSEVTVAAVNTTNGTNATGGWGNWTAG